MKKSTRILLVIVLCLVLIAISIPKWFSFNAYNYDNAAQYTAGPGQFNQTVKNIDIGWISGELNVAQHNGSDIILSETASRKLKKAEEVHWLLKGDTLYVRYARGGKNISSRLDKELTLLLPAGMQLDDVVISGVSAEMQADLPPANGVTINSVSGTADVSLQQAKTVNVDTVSGDVLLLCAGAPDTIDTNAVSADITVQLPAGAGFTAELDSVSGKIGGQLLEGAADTKSFIHGNGSCAIRMDSVSGDLQLDPLTR